MQLPELPSVPHAVKAYDVRRALNDRYLLVRSVERQGCGAAHTLAWASSVSRE
jgi:hypothetical protein